MLLPILHLFNDGYLAAMPLVLPFAAEEFSIPLSIVGLLGSLLSFSGIILALPAGAAAARFGAVRLLSFAVLCYSIGFLLLGTAGGIAAIFAAFILGSIAFGIFHPIAFSAVAKESSSSQLGRNMGIFAATGDIGRIAFAAAVTFIIGLTSWRFTSFLYGIAALFLFLFCFIYALRRNDGNKETASKSKKKLDYSILKKKAFGLSNVASFLDSFANASLFIFIPFLLTFRGIDAAFIGVFTSVFFVGNLLGKVIMGRLTALIILALSPSAVIISLLALILGFFTKGTVPIVSTMIAQSVGETEYEAAYSVNSLSTSIANTLAPLFFGLLADILGVQAIFSACGIAALLASIPAIVLVKTKNA